jgi:hypothetical protein
MRDEAVKALQSVAAGFFLSLCLAFPSLAHVSPGYAHDERILTRNPDWMGKLKDDVRISQLSLPARTTRCRSMAATRCRRRRCACRNN